MTILGKILSESPNGTLFQNPKSLSGLSLWLDATDLNGDDTSNNPIDGTAVSSWVDKSGDGNNFDQASGTNQPVYRTNIIGSNPAILFDGIDNYLENVKGGMIGNISNQFTLFIICQPESDPGGVGVFYNSGRPSLSPGYFISRIATAPGYEEYYTAGGDLLINYPAGIMPSSSAYINTFVRKPEPGFDFYLDGALQAGTPSGGPQKAQIDATADKAIIGSLYFGGSPAFFYNGYVSEVIFYDRQLNDDERGEVEQYLSDKWGITI